MQLNSKTPSVFFVLLGEKGVQSALTGIDLPSHVETNTLWYKAYSMLRHLPILQERY